jgi:cobalt-zinc-cadmium efflux system outer membrane protein
MSSRRAMAAAVLLACACAAHAQVSASAGSPLDVSELTLPAAEGLLFLRNRDIGLARRAIGQAEADVMIAGQKPNPQLGVSVAGINRALGVGAGSLRDKTVDSVVGISQTFERGDKAGLRVAAAQSLTSAVTADAGDIVRTQLLALRQAYYDLLAAQERLAGSAETAQLFGKTLEAATLRQRAGDLAGSDVARVAVDAARARNDVTASAADQTRARLALGVLIATEVDALSLRAVSPWPAPDSALPAEQDLLAKRPDVRAAAARVEAADRMRELARSLRTRDVTVSAQFEHYPASDTNPGGSGNSFGFGVSVPLFLRHSYEGEAARAQADWYTARDAYERTVALARADIARSHGDVAAARERRLRIETDLLPQARKSADAAEFAFRNGAIGVMDLLDARRTLRAIQIEATAARVDHARALSALRAGVEELAPAALDATGSASRKESTP